MMSVLIMYEREVQVGKLLMQRTLMGGETLRERTNHVCTRAPSSFRESRPPSSIQRQHVRQHGSHANANHVLVAKDRVYAEEKRG